MLSAFGEGGLSIELLVGVLVQLRHLRPYRELGALLAQGLRRLAMADDDLAEAGRLWRGITHNRLK
ncbi:MAG: hypothetical protein WAP35_00315 [Solirubrobacterales bacterium]